MIGAVNDALNWRWTFHILGIAGLSLVPLVTVALWEPAEVRSKRKERQKGKSSYTIKVKKWRHYCGTVVLVERVPLNEN